MDRLLHGLLYGLHRWHRRICRHRLRLLLRVLLGSSILARVHGHMLVESAIVDLILRHIIHIHLLRLPLLTLVLNALVLRIPIRHAVSIHVARLGHLLLAIVVGLPRRERAPVGHCRDIWRKTNW